MGTHVCIGRVYYSLLSVVQKSLGASNFCCIESLGSCAGPAGICVQFYDSAPGGRFGTMSYLSQAVANQLRELHFPPDQCKIN